MTNNLYLSFRVLTSLIFITAWIGHLFNPGKVLKRLADSTIYQWLPMPSLFLLSVMISGIIMLAGGISLTFRVKWAGAALLLMLIPITLSVQLENLDDLGPFFKNVALSGSLIVLIKIKKHEFS